MLIEKLIKENEEMYKAEKQILVDSELKARSIEVGEDVSDPTAY